MKFFRILPVFFLLFSLLIPASSLQAADSATEAVRFKWAFILQPAGSIAETVIDFKGVPTVHSGDKLRVYVEPLDNTCVYLYLEDSQNNLTLLFPGQPDGYAGSGADRNQQRFIPDENGWFQMDTSVGVEKFILLASHERLTKLEAITKDFLDHPNDGERKAAVLEEIKNTRNKYSELTSTAEKGVPIVGTIRTKGLSAKITGLASLVETQRFYVKTLRLNHE